MATVGEINEEISKLRSKIAVAKGLVLYLKTHYMPSDGGQPEMYFTRSDFGRTPAEHVELCSADIVEYLDGLTAKLHKLENTPVAELLKEPVMPTEPPAGTTSVAPAEEPKPETTKVVRMTGSGHPKPLTKETPSGTANRSQDPPATGQAAAGHR